MSDAPGPSDRPGRRPGAASGPQTWAADLARCLRFASRLPLPALPWEGEAHSGSEGTEMLRMLPLAGAAIACVGALVFTLAQAFGLGPLVSATLAVAALTLATGALHEDGLADTADGLAGGSTPGRRLEIMADSRIGSFGASALVLAFALRIGALATLADRLDARAVAAALVIVGTVSRGAALVPMGLLPPARATGLGQILGTGSATTHATAWALSAAVAAGLGWLAALPASGVALAFGLAAAAGLGTAALARRLIHGHTGDVAGAAQQVAEVAALLGLLIALRA